MKNVKVICPKCGNSVTLTKYGSYLNKELRGFEPIYEGWCPNCVERLVEHKALSDYKNYKSSGTRSKLPGRI
jgi:hypothetical protein